uniref:Uncharacterized protein n=1 Tax=Anguilla anguilla TaxID=7936 RepID=A0A0E9SMF9_ANGAN
MSLFLFFKFFFSKFVKYIHFQRHHCLLVSHFQKFIYCTFDYIASYHIAITVYDHLVASM